MDLIDAHVHAECLSWSNLQEMSDNGIRAMISASVWPWRAGVDANTQIALVKRLLRHETWRANENNLSLYVAIGIVGLSVPKDVDKFFRKVEDYLREQCVVAIGEVGFDPRSQTCKDLKKQEEVLSLQLTLAKDKGLPVIIHTPPDLGQMSLAVNVKYEKKRFMEKSMEFVHRVGLPVEMVVLDHLETEEWVRFALDNGCYAGITIQQWRGVSPEQAAQLAGALGPEKVLLSTDTSSMPSDHLGGPKAVFHMRKREIPEKKIQDMVYQNPLNFFRLPL